MMVARKVPDALAALSCGLGTVLISARVKSVPESIAYLGQFAVLWGFIVLLTCLAAAVGALLRMRVEPDVDPPRRAVVSVIMERTAWPALGVCAVVFAIGVVNRLGFIDGAITVGWTGFVIFTCLGHWLALVRAGRRQPPPGVAQTVEVPRP